MYASPTAPVYELGYPGNAAAFATVPLYEIPLPAAPVGPVGPGVVDVGPVAPVGPVGPAVPAVPVGPVGPVPPVCPVGPVGPGTVDAAPVAPVGPVGPVIPVGPVGPVGPAFPVAPVGPIPFRLAIACVDARTDTPACTTSTCSVPLRDVATGRLGICMFAIRADLFLELRRNYTASRDQRHPARSGLFRALG